MKTHFKIIAMIALVMLGFISCKKQKDKAKPEQKQKEQLYALKIDVINADSTLKKITSEKGIIVGTKEDFKKMNKNEGKDGKGMSMKMVGPHNNVFVPWSDPNKPPIGNKDLCMQQIYQIKVQHWNEWKNEANEKCKVVKKTVRCPMSATYDYGPFDWDHRTFFVYPDELKCGPLSLLETIIKIPFNVNDEDDNGDEGFDFDSEKVAEFIEKM